MSGDRARAPVPATVATSVGEMTAGPPAPGGATTAAPGGAPSVAGAGGGPCGPCWASTDAPPAAMTMRRVRPADRGAAVAARPFHPGRLIEILLPSGVVVDRQQDRDEVRSSVMPHLNQAGPGARDRTCPPPALSPWKDRTDSERERGGPRWGAGPTPC